MPTLRDTFPRSADNIREDLRQVNQNLASDWERVRKGGIYDPARRESLFAVKRNLLNELTKALNPALPTIPATADISNPVHDQKHSLIIRAMNTAQRVTLSNEQNEAIERQRKMQERVNGFTRDLRQKFSLNYAEMRKIPTETTKDDPLIVGDGGVYLSYFLDTDEHAWRIQAGLETDQGVRWDADPVSSMYELGQAIERILSGDSLTMHYTHEKEAS